MLGYYLVCIEVIPNTVIYNVYRIVGLRKTTILRKNDPYGMSILVTK